MERKDFLKQAAALCGLAVVPAGIVASCSKQSYTGPTNVNFSLDLTSIDNAALNNPGGSVVANGVLVMRSAASIFYAVSATCTHQGCTLGYVPSTDKVYCPCHGGTFDPSTGGVLAGPPPSPLTKYFTQLSGNILTVKSY